VFDPTGLWVDLAVFFLGKAYDEPAMVEDHTTCAGGPLVDGRDIFWHIPVPG
jgi:hypothetical protein